MRGGAGKTLISVGLCAAWKRHLGLRVVAFKKGPDYIDAGWLSAASGGSCYNLDPFLMSPEQILRSFVMRSARADVSLIEGNRASTTELTQTAAIRPPSLPNFLGARLF